MSWVTFCSDERSVNGWPWKWTAIGSAPRRIIRQAATGESMPAERRATTGPAVPTGRPPGPGILAAET